ncbi:MAG: hypothetical protein OEZ01_01845 [Candidatus Heimdallarchaeota archaeon]|nr:hypothetical protein [Candidatus Heimdallarchaeota archaeon]MDH5644716.1 hypothetical protein [Candidatus Heimdallarchaeota archaeon]
MPQALLFDSNGKPKEILQVEGNIDKINPLNISWINLRAGDDLSTSLPIIVNRSSSFTEDFIEEQRPRIEIYQTLEDNEDTYSVLIFAFPTNKIYLEDEFQIQISFLIIDNTIYTTSTKDNQILIEIMTKLVSKKKNYTLTKLFEFIISETLEMSIKVMDELIDYVESLERHQLKQGLKRGWLGSLLMLKGRLFDSSKLLKADLEHIQEIQTGEVPEIDTEIFGGHVEDRFLFLLDQTDSLRENLSNMINMNIAIQSNIMNKNFYYLTIIGSLLIIPTVISSLWGMNLSDVPQIGFWPMFFVITVLTLLSGFIVKLILPKPILS